MTTTKPQIRVIIATTHIHLEKQLNHLYGLGYELVSLIHHNSLTAVLKLLPVLPHVSCKDCTA